MNKVLITGGTGFVGSHLLRYLTARGSEVAVLASSGCENALPNVRCYKADIRDADAVHAAIHEFKPMFICHLAAISSVGTSWKSPRLTYEVNVFGTLNVIEAAADLSSPPRILSVSTAQVYAPNLATLSETSPLAPDNPYAASKAMAELLRVQYRRGAAGGVIVARSFNHAGPGQSTDFVLSSIAKQFAETQLGLREPKLSLGNLHVKRDFTDVRDVVRAYALLLEKTEVEDVYNVCSGRSRSIGEIVKMFEFLSGVNVTVESHSSKQRLGESDQVCGDPAKIRDATGWEPQIPFSTTLQDLLAYWRDVLVNSSENPSERNSLAEASVQLLSK
jgi:GDP-4-dehydro-6-deoxy-D-mannose reductase